jgi:hypothetical protein
MPLFTPPTRSDVPGVNPATPENDRKPMVFFNTHIPRYVNVFIMNDNSVVEGSPIWDNVAYAYYGARSYQINPAQATILTAAGYGGNIT